MFRSRTDNSHDAGPSVRGTSLVARARRHAIFWASSSMRDVEADVAAALRCHLNVMITGEHGVGKASIADRIHQRRRRSAGRCVIARSPGALDSIESLAIALTEALPGGMVHVEDADQMSRAIQARMLEFIKRQTMGRAASTPVRFITVSHTNLFELVRCDEFCESLFYRLNVIHLIIPPLRDHPEDIPVLLRHFMSFHAPALAPRLSRAAWHRLVTYEWPGNIRELQTVAETLVSHKLDRTLDLDDLPSGVRPPGES